MLARKGVLISNQDVQKMRPAQWLFEYAALRDRENDQHELITAVVKQAKRLLVSMLGLDLAAQMVGGEDTTQLTGEDDDAPIVPLALLTGNPEMINHIMETLKKEKSESTDIADAEFDALSAKLAKGDIGDLDPIIFGPVDESVFKNAYVRSDEYKQAMTALGVKIRDG